MNIQEALDELKDKCRRAGAEWAEKIEPNQRQYDKAIPAAESAVLELYEKQKAIADELAEAVRGYIEDDDATVSELKAALAAYNKAKEG